MVKRLGGIIHKAPEIRKQWIYGNRRTAVTQLHKLQLSFGNIRREVDPRMNPAYIEKNNSEYEVYQYENPERIFFILLSDKPGDQCRYKWDKYKIPEQEYYSKADCNAGDPFEGKVVNLHGIE